MEVLVWLDSVTDLLKDFARNLLTGCEHCAMAASGQQDEAGLRAVPATLYSTFKANTGQKPNQISRSHCTDTSGRANKQKRNQTIEIALEDAGCHNLTCYKATVTIASSLLMNCFRDISRFNCSKNSLSFRQKVQVPLRAQIWSAYAVQLLQLTVFWYHSSRSIALKLKRCCL